MQIDIQNHEIFIQQKAKELCSFLGNESPDNRQLSVVEKLIYSWSMPLTISFKEYLTEREKTYLYYVAKGFNSEKIALLMKVRKTTIKKYRQKIFEKLRCNTLVEAVIKSGLILRDMSILV